MYSVFAIWISVVVFGHAAGDTSNQHNEQLLSLKSLAVSKARGRTPRKSPCKQNDSFNHCESCGPSETRPNKEVTKQKARAHGLHFIFRLQNRIRIHITSDQIKNCYSATCIRLTSSPSIVNVLPIQVLSYQELLIKRPINDRNMIKHSAELGLQMSGRSTKCCQCRHLQVPAQSTKRGKPWQTGLFRDASQCWHQHTSTTL